MEPQIAQGAPKIGRPMLLALPHAASRYGLPDSYTTARETFDAAQQDFEDGEPGRAAPKFMQAAALLKSPNPPVTYSKQFAAMRLVAYENAVICFLEAADVEGGKKALNKALSLDTDQAAAIKKLLERLR